MTSPLTPQPAYAHPESSQRVPVHRAAPERPGGVTFACVLSIVLGSFGALGGLALLALGSAFTSVMPALGLLGAMAAVLGLFVAAVGALGIAAGIVGLKGKAWARWTMVVLFGIGAAQFLLALPEVLPLVLVALEGSAIFFLVNGQASAWFGAHAEPR